MNTARSLPALVQGLIDSGFDIAPICEAPWIDDVEQTLGFRMPNPFRSFMSGYRFGLLELKRIELFGNSGLAEDEDFCSIIFRDPLLSPWLVANRLLHFARIELGNYDPICLDLRGNSADPPVVVVSHEDVLLARAGVRIKPFAPSFTSLLERN